MSRQAKPFNPLSHRALATLFQRTLFQRTFARPLARTAALCLLATSCGKALPASLTPGQRAQAVERGQALETAHQRDQDGLGYHLLKTEAPFPARIHKRLHVSLYALSGSADWTVSGVRHRLEPGASIFIPAGEWYRVDRVRPGSSFLLFTSTNDSESFAKDRKSAIETRLTKSQREL